MLSRNKSSTSCGVDKTTWAGTLRPQLAASPSTSFLSETARNCSAPAAGMQTPSNSSAWVKTALKLSSVMGRKTSIDHSAIRALTDLENSAGELSAGETARSATACFEAPAREWPLREQTYTR